MIIAHFDRAEVLALEPKKYGGSIPGRTERFRLTFPVNDPQGVIAWEAFDAGKTTEWSYWHPEFHVCMSGSADIEYTLPPNHTQILRTHVREGDAILILGGTRAIFHVPEGEPYVHMSLFQPRYEYSKYLLSQDYSGVGRR